MLLRRFPILLAAVAALMLAATAQTVNPALLSGLSWRLVGPFRAGRAVAVAGVPSQPDVYYFGAVDGGVWKTIDDGTTWTPIFDHEPVGAIGAIAVAPSNPDVIYVGTGEADMRSQISYGEGMFKSTDGGATWTRIGLEDTQQIGRIVVDPHNPDRVFVAALGHAYGPNPERGVFRSTDGGQHWDKVLYKNENLGAIDLALDPANADVVYATLWSARRPPWNVYPAANGPGAGIFKSTDGGNTWQPLTVGLPGDDADGNVGKIGIAVAPSNPNVVYAVVDHPIHGGVYRSDDAGATWHLTDNEARIWERGWYFEAVTVDPENPDKLYVMDTSTYRSEDGGKTFDAIKGAPGGDDYHQLWINPTDPNRMVLSSDQGVIVTVDGARSWSSWNNQPTAQFYHITADNRDPFWVYGAQQDSGARAMPIAAERGGRLNFHEWTSSCTGGESGDIVANPLAEAEVYGSTVTRCNMLTGESHNINPLPGWPDDQYRHTWTLPLAFSMADKHAFYFSNQYLFKTEDAGRDWQKISPDLTRPNPGDPPNLDAATAADKTFQEKNYGPRMGVIYAIAPSPLLPDEIWVGTDDGYIQVTRDGGKSWSNVTPPGLSAWSKVIMIEASHTRPDSAYAAVDRHRIEDFNPHIYRTRDGGKSWTEIDRGIPAGDYLLAIKEDPQRPGLLYAGTAKGVFISFDDGDNWQSLQLNLPVVEVRDFVIKDNTVVIATFGRSFWALDDIAALRQVKPAMNDAAAVLYQPETAVRRAAAGRGGGGGRTSLAAATDMDPVEVASGDPAPTGAVIDYYLKSDAQLVTLDIVDAAGKSIRHYASNERVVVPNPRNSDVPAVWAAVPAVLPATAGGHRWSWDMRALTAGAEAAAGGRGGRGGGRGGAAGTEAAPGHYTVRLTVDGTSYTQPLTVTMAPGVTFDAAGVAAQAAFTKQVGEVQQQVQSALRVVTGVEAQLVSLRDQAAGQADLVAAIDQLTAKLRKLQGAVSAPPNPDATGVADAVPPPNSLQGLITVLSGVNGAGQDGMLPPSGTAQAGFARAQAMATSNLAAWKQIQTQDVAQLNTRLQQAHLPVLALTPAAGGRGGRGGGGGGQK